MAVLRQTLSYAWNGFLDLVYPPRCLICEAEGETVICERCAAGFTPLEEPLCATCGRPQSPGVPCPDCVRAAKRGGWGFDAARAAGIYRGPLREGIHLLKYGKQELLGEPLGAFLANRCLTEGLLPPELLREIDIIAPVPLHWTRQWKRGFNQARLLAEPIAQQSDLPLSGELRRIRRTPKQAMASGDDRRRNVTRHMFVADRKAFSGKGVLLVDDVFTTGTTTSACAAALKDAGATKVIVVTLATGG
jgi:ComF family protein